MTKPVELGFQEYSGFDGSRTHLPKQPALLTLWASWCKPCLEELADFSNHAEQLSAAGVRVVPLCTDPLDAATANLVAAEELMDRFGMSGVAGLATADNIADLAYLQSWMFYRQRPLPLPTSFLLNDRGQIAVIYRGPTTAAQIIKDTNLLNASPTMLTSQVLPESGHFAFPSTTIHPLELVRAYREGGYFEDARTELMKTLDKAPKSAGEAAQLRDGDRRFLVGLYRELSVVEAGLGNAPGVVAACRQASMFLPNDPGLKVSLAVALANQGERDQAVATLRKLADGETTDSSVQHHTAESAAAAVPVAKGVVNWAVNAFFSGIVGLILGGAIALGLHAVKGKKAH